MNFGEKYDFPINDPAVSGAGLNWGKIDAACDRAVLPADFRPLTNSAAPAE